MVGGYGNMGVAATGVCRFGLYSLPSETEYNKILCGSSTVVDNLHGVSEAPGYAQLPVPVSDAMVTPRPLNVSRVGSELSDRCADTSSTKTIFNGSEIEYVNFLMGDFTD